MNIFLVAVLVGGLYSATQLRRETFPEFDLDIIVVLIPLSPHWLSGKLLRMRGTKAGMKRSAMTETRTGDAA